MQDNIGYTDERPWGRYTILDKGSDFQVKRLEVEPGKRFSLQSHKQRSEIWIVVNGSFSITLDDEKVVANIGDVININIGQRHRAECISEDKGIFIEVQRGDYLGEDDIIRYEDDFGRT